MDPIQHFSNQLAAYLPETTSVAVTRLFSKYNVTVRISRNRASKLGDYRPPQNGRKHTISINEDLNPYAFLITLIHELAHLINWEQYRGNIKPHGKEWKQTFQELMKEFVNDDVFPPDVLPELKDYLKNPRATSSSHGGLYKALRRYNEHPIMHLADLEDGTVFQMKNGRAFKRIAKLRKRYRCQDLHNKRYYLIHELAEVNLVNN